MRNGVPRFTWWSLLCLPMNRAHPHTQTSTKAGGSSEGSWAKGEEGKRLGTRRDHRGTGEEGELHLKLGTADPALGETTAKPTPLILHHGSATKSTSTSATRGSPALSPSFSGWDGSAQGLTGGGYEVLSHAVIR